MRRADADVAGRIAERVAGSTAPSPLAAAAAVGGERGRSGDAAAAGILFDAKCCLARPRSLLRRSGCVASGAAAAVRGAGLRSGCASPRLRSPARPRAAGASPGSRSSSEGGCSVSFTALGSPPSAPRPDLVRAGPRWPPRGERRGGAATGSRSRSRSDTACTEFPPASVFAECLRPAPAARAPPPPRLGVPRRRGSGASKASCTSRETCGSTDEQDERGAGTAGGGFSRRRRRHAT